MFEYTEKRQNDKSFEGSLNRILNTAKKEIHVKYPAKIITVKTALTSNIIQTVSLVFWQMSRCNITKHKMPFSL